MVSKKANYTSPVVEVKTLMQIEVLSASLFHEAQDNDFSASGLYDGGWN